MKYNDLYLGIEDNEEELYLALSSVISDELVVRDAIKNYKLGKAQDLVYAENAIAKGGSFAIVDKVLGTNIKRRASSRPVFDTKLRKALIKSKGLPDKVFAYDAHHIVAKDCARAKRAKEILFALGIDIDEPDNGVFLPKDGSAKKGGNLKQAYIHGNVHTKPYYANVNIQIIEAFENGATKDDVKSLLRDIADELRRGVYPIHHYLPGAEDYA
jgi:hypothetical protein